MSPAPLNNVLITLLAEPANTGPDFGKASPVGLLVVVLLLIGVFVLVWSMNRELKKVPQSFDPPADASDATVAADSTPVTDELAGEPKGESSG